MVRLPWVSFEYGHEKLAQQPGKYHTAGAEDGDAAGKAALYND